MRILLLAAAAVVLAVVVPSSARAADEPLPELVGTVGPGFTIVLEDATGKRVDTLPAGRYRLTVHDLSDIHNFVLGSKQTGEHLIETEVPFVGDKTAIVDLTPGRYTYACSPHFSFMNGHLVVLPATTATPKPKPKVRSLRATVTGRSIVFRAKALKAGRYRITVVDRSKTAGFALRGPGVNRKTTARFRGTVRWTVTLKHGVYRFGNGSKPTRRLRVR